MSYLIATIEKIESVGDLNIVTFVCADSETSNGKFGTL